VGQAEEGEMSESSKRKHRRIGPRTEAETRRIENIAAAHRTPEHRASQSEAAKAALSSEEVRQRISDGTTDAYKRPEVKQNLREGLKGVWAGNTPRREQARETAKAIFGNPEVEQRRREGFARPETREKISQGGKLGWEGDEERRQQTSARSTQLWAERKQKLAEAERILADAKGAKEQITQLEQLALTETTSKKLAEPAKYMWMSPNEAAEAFGINRATFFRNVGRYPRLKKGPKKWYLTSSVIDQLNTLPKK
jgi:hypothetical protein